MFQRLVTVSEKMSATVHKNKLYRCKTIDSTQTSCPVFTDHCPVYKTINSTQCPALFSQIVVQYTKLSTVPNVLPCFHRSLSSIQNYSINSTQCPALFSQIIVQYTNQ